MATTITAGNATNGAIIVGDNTGILELKTGTGSGTTGLTINASQNATFAGTVASGAITATGSITATGAIQASGVTTNLYPLVSGTAITLTNQTAPEFTGIPSWAKRITLMFNSVSTNSSSPIQVQIGDSGGFEDSGYTCLNTVFATGVAQVTTFTAGFGITASTTYTGAGAAFNGHIVLTNISANIWIATCVIGTTVTTPYSFITNGNKTLSGVLDRVRITTANGTDQFDAGSINIMWE